MKKLSILLCVALCFSSCNFKGSTTDSLETMDVDFTETDIVGNWHLDKFSYKILSVNDSIIVDSIQLTFNRDRTFTLNNSGSIFQNKFDNKRSEEHWNISQAGIYKSLHLNFNKKDVELQVFKQGKDFQLWYIFGDPDNEERLRFLKISPALQSH